MSQVTSLGIVTMGVLAQFGPRVQALHPLFKFPLYNTGQSLISADPERQELCTYTQFPPLIYTTVMRQGSFMPTCQGRKHVWSNCPRPLGQWPHKSPIGAEWLLNSRASVLCSVTAGIFGSYHLLALCRVEAGTPCYCTHHSG